jgi:hypothetical protein
MEGAGYSVGLHHVLFDKNGTARVLSAEVTPPTVDNAGLGGAAPQTPHTRVMMQGADQRQNAVLLDGLRGRVRVILAAEKAGLSPAELERASRFEERRQATLDGGPVLSPVPVDPRDGEEYHRLLSQVECGGGTGSPDRTPWLGEKYPGIYYCFPKDDLSGWFGEPVTLSFDERVMAKTMVRDSLALRRLEPKPGTSYQWSEGLGQTGWTEVPTPRGPTTKPEGSYVWSGRAWIDLQAAHATDPVAGMANELPVASGSD